MSTTRIFSAAMLGMMLTAFATNHVFAQSKNEESSKPRGLFSFLVAPKETKSSSDNRSKSKRTVKSQYVSSKKQYPQLTSGRQQIAPKKVASKNQHPYPMTDAAPPVGDGCSTEAGCKTGPEFKAHVKHKKDGTVEAQPTFLERLSYKWKNYWKPALQEEVLGYPEEFCEKPLGYHLHANMKTQVANAEAARMTLYEYDFELNSARLTRRGMHQLEKIAYMTPRNFFPIVIAPSREGNELDIARRQAIIEVLASRNFPVPPERVMVARPVPFGVDGHDATINYANYTASVSAGGSFLVEGATQGASGTTAQGATVQGAVTTQ